MSSPDSLCPISSLTSIVLAGGKGTRLQAIVPDRPKVLAEVNGRPFLSYVLDKFHEAGIRSVVLATGHMGDQIWNNYHDSYKSLSIKYSHEEEPLGTGGALRQALYYADSETVLVANGDSWVDIDLKKYLKWHFHNNFTASILAVHVENRSRFGRIELDEPGRIYGFGEKLVLNEPGWINAGVYLLEKSKIEKMPPEKRFSLEHDLLPDLITAGLYAYRHRGYFVDIGTIDACIQAEDDFKNLTH